MSDRSEPGTPVVTPAGGGYLEAGGEPFLVQGFAVPSAAGLDEETIRRFAAHGGTTVRLWSDFYERGTVDVEMLRSVRVWAERHGVRILFVVFSPAFLSDIFEEQSRFEQGLTAFNGLIARPVDVVSSEAALEALVARCRAVLAAFGSSPALLGWEVVNQADDLYDVATTAMRDFIRRLADRIRAEDRRSGTERLIAASASRAVPPAWALDLEDTDFVAFHPYAESIEFPTNRIDGALHVAGAIRYALSAQARPRPILDTESGPIGQLYVSGLPRPGVAFRAELMHNLRWAHLAAGGAGTGLHIPVNDEGMTATRRVPLSRLRWAPLTAELADLAAIGRFWSLSPGRGPVRSLSADATADRDDVTVIASATPGRTIGWLLRDTRGADLAGDVDDALAAGPTVLATFDRRLHALDACRAALARRCVEPLNFAGRKAITLLAGRGRTGMHRAGELIDEELTHLVRVIRQLAPDLLDAGPVTPSPITLRLGGLPAGRHRVQWVDDGDGHVIGSTTVSADGSAVRLESPKMDRHLAFVIRPEGPDTGKAENDDVRG
jgi:hypothetical protein